MDTPRVKIYSDAPSPRLGYISRFILGEILGLQSDIVADRRKIGNNPVINYSSLNITGALNIHPYGLLEETGYRSLDPDISEWKGMPVLFQSPSGYDVPFDIFSASFFLLSRYEEYYPQHTDSHGRFRASDSVAFRNSFLRKPLIDNWVREFAQILVRKFPKLAVRKNNFRSLVTVDVDEPFAYYGKNIIKRMGELLHDVAIGKANASDSYKVVTHEKKDPYQVFDYILSVIKRNVSDARFFITVGDRTQWDHNPSWKNEEYRRLIRDIAALYPAGLHPSYNAAIDAGLLSKEYNRLNVIIGSDVTASRFHYLRLKLPDSYRNLTDTGIKEDFSMGYPEEPGFRAGVARPFNFYDISSETETNLRITPLMVMDATFTEYLTLGPAEAGRIIMDLIAETRAVGGLFVSLWHNTSLLDDEEHKGWRSLFESILQIRS